MWSILRRCTAVLTSAALVSGLSGVPAALADDFSRVDRNPVQGGEVVLADGTEAPTALFSLRVADSASVSAYTAEADGEVRPRAAYVESVWDDHPRWTETEAVTDPADQAAWVVANSYPHVTLTDLALASETVFLDERQAIAGTQAALWHVLDGAELDPDANDATVTALYEYLIAGSADAPDEPGVPSLEITPPQLEAVAPEEPLGPLTVTSSGSEPVRVSVRGAPASWLVDADGDQVRRVRDGDSVYLDVDPSVPAGVVTLHARGNDVPLAGGRLFTGRDGVRTQPLVTAEPGTATRSAAATLTWRSEEPEEIAGPAPGTPAPSASDPGSPAAGADAPEAGVPDTTPSDSPSGEPEEEGADEDLAGTGTWLSGLLIIAGALVVSGLIILVLGRKRRS